MKILRNVTDFDPGSDTPQGAMGLGTAIAAGDLTGTHGVPIVSGVGGVGITGTPASGDILIATSSSAAAWTTNPGLTNPMTTQDDIIVGGASGVPGRLAKGTDGQVLTVDPTTHHLLWATPGAGSSPLTTKGDLYGYSTTNARIPIGSDTQVLTADSTQALGLKWAAASGGGVSGFLPIQDKGSGAGVNTNARTGTLGAAPTNGNLLIMCIDRDATGAINNITQTGVTWTQLATSGNSVAPVVEIWKGVVGSSASASFTINCATSTFTGFHCSEWPSTLAGTLGATKTISGQSSSQPATGTLLPASSSAFVIGAGSTNSNPTLYRGSQGMTSFDDMVKTGATVGAGYAFPGTVPVNGSWAGNIGTMSSLLLTLT